MSNPTGPVRFRINYQYIAKNSRLLGGTIVVEADSASVAQAKAEAILTDFKLDGYRITSVKVY